MSELFAEVYEPNVVMSWRDLFRKYTINGAFDHIHLYFGFILFEQCDLPADIVNLIFAKIGAFELRREVTGSILRYLTRWTTTPNMQDYNPLLQFKHIGNIITEFKYSNDYDFQHFARVNDYGGNQITNFGDILLGIIFENINAVERCGLLFNNTPLRTDYILSSQYTAKFIDDTCGEIRYYYNPELPVVPIWETGFTTWKLDIKYKENMHSKVSLVYGFYKDSVTGNYAQIYNGNKFIVRYGHCGYI